MVKLKTVILGNTRIEVVLLTWRQFKCKFNSIETNTNHEWPESQYSRSNVNTCLKYINFIQHEVRVERQFCFVLCSYR